MQEEGGIYRERFDPDAYRNRPKKWPMYDPMCTYFADFSAELRSRMRTNWPSILSSDPN